MKLPKDKVIIRVKTGITYVYYDAYLSMKDGVLKARIDGYTHRTELRPGECEWGVIYENKSWTDRNKAYSTMLSINYELHFRWNKARQKFVPKDT